MAHSFFEKHNIQADIREYYLFWYEDIPENCNQSFVGEIRNTTNEKIVIPIRVDNQWMAERNQRHCTLFVDNNNHLENSYIVITKQFFDSVRKEDHLLSFLWHEMGHYHTAKYYSEYMGPNQSKLRKEYIENEKVYPAEYVADLMAAYYAGIDNTVYALRKGARERLELAKTGDGNASKSWWEYRMRRKAIQDLKNNEEIEAEICKICGVEGIEEV